MMTTGWLAIVLAGWMLAADGPGIHVTAMARDGRVHVTAAVSDGFAADTDQALRSGLTATFTYDVDLRRAVNVWFDAGIAEATVTASARFDTLTGRYQVSRSVDGRIEDSRVTADKGEVLRVLAAFDRLPLFSTADLDANGEYLVRVRLRTRPRTNWLLWPFNRSDASGFARFTFIP